MGEIGQDVAQIVDAIDASDARSLVDGINALRALLDTASPDSAPVIRAALIEPLLDLGEHDEARDCALALVADRLASPQQRAEAEFVLGRTALSEEQSDDGWRHLERALEHIEQSEDLGDAAALGAQIWWRRHEQYADPVRWLADYLDWAQERIGDISGEPARYVLWLAVTESLELDGDAARNTLDRILSWPRPEGAEVALAGAEFKRAKMDARSGAASTALPRLMDLADRATAHVDSTVVAIGLDALLEAGQIHSDAGDLVAAYDVFARAAGFCRHDQPVLVRRVASQASYRSALVLRDAGRGAKADQALQRHGAVAATDPDGEVRAWYAESLFDQARDGDEPARDLLEALIAAFEGDPSIDVQRIVGRVHLSRAAAYASLKQDDQARVSYEAIIRLAENDHTGDEVLHDGARAAREFLTVLDLRAGDYSRMDEIYPVAMRLLEGADAASLAGDFASAERDYRRAHEMAIASPDVATRLLAVTALHQLLPDLVAAQRWREVMQVGDVILRDVVSLEGVRARIVAMATLNHIGVSATRLGDRVTAVRAYDDCLARWGGDLQHPQLIDEASKASYNRAVVLDDRSAPVAAVEAYEQVTNLSGPASPVHVQRRSAKAITNKALVLREELGRPDLAELEFARLVALFEGSSDAELLRLVERAQGELPRARGWRRGKRR